QHRDDVLEAVGLQLLEQLLHALACQLEHRGRVRVPQHLVGLRRVEAELLHLEPELWMPPDDVAVGQVDDGQAAQAERVDIHPAATSSLSIWLTTPASAPGGL